MTLKQLETFVSLIQSKSFSKTAKELCVSQPSVSIAVNSLEEEFMVKLVNRSTREITPTMAGKEFFKYAKSIIQMTEKAKKSLATYSDHGQKEVLSGTITLCASSVPCDYILPSLISEFRLRHPQVVFEIEQGKSADIARLVASGKSSIGFSGYKGDVTKCNYLPVINDGMVLISNNPREQVQQLNTLIENEYFVGRSLGSGSAKVFEDFLGTRANDIKYSASFSNTDSVIAAVARGLGIAVISKLAATNHIKANQIYQLNIAEELPTREIYLVTKKDNIFNQETNAFYEFILEYFNK